MRISIDSTPLKSAHELRGIGWYTKHLIDGLKKYYPDYAIKLFNQEEKIPKDSDIVHFPYFDPFFSTLRLVHKTKVVITIHDLIPLVYSQAFSPGLRGKVAWYLQKRRAKKIQAIITDSKASKKDIIRFMGIKEDRIHVIYLAQSEEFRPIDDQKLLKKTHQKYELSGKVILYVGDINYNKNIPTLLKAFSQVVSAFPSTTLLLVGESFLGSAQEAKIIDATIEQLNIKKNIRRLGFISISDLVGLYNNATLYVQPSLYEGFGLPVLEAMACGCPVVATAGGSLPEITGNASIRVDANDIDSMAKGMTMVLNLSKNERQNLIDKGLIQAAKFRWQNTIKDTVTVYQRLLVK